MSEVLISAIEKAQQRLGVKTKPQDISLNTIADAQKRTYEKKFTAAQEKLNSGWLSPAEFDDILSTFEEVKGKFSIDQASYNDLITSFNQKKSLYGNFKNRFEYDMAVATSPYQGLTYKQVQEELEKEGPVQFKPGAINIDPKEYLKNYGMTVGYSDTESYAQEIAALDAEIATLDKQLYASISPHDSRGNYSQNEKSKLQEKRTELETKKAFFERKQKEVGAEELFEQKYKPVKQAADFEQKAVPNKKIDDAFYQLATGTGFDGTDYEYFSAQDDLALFDEFKEDEKKVYLYLADPQNMEAARKYFDDMRPLLNARRNETQTKRNKEFSDKVPGLSDILTLGSQLIDGTIMAPKKFIGSLTGDYEKNWASYDSLTTFTNTIRTDHAQDLNKLAGGEWAGFVYNTVMSIADMGTALAVGGAAGKIVGAASSAANTTNIAKGVTQFIMSSEAASQTMTDARQRGLSGIQIAALGVASGTIEALTEKLPLDNLFGAKPSYVKAVVKQIATEGTEEAISNVANTILDEIIAGNQSALKQQIGDLMASGMSYQDAANKVLIDKVKEIGMDALAGALSGAVMGGGSVALNKLSTVHFSIPTKYKGDLSSAQTWVADKFQNLKNSTNKKGLGTVVVDSQTMTDAIHKTETADQALTFAAINDVIHKGKVELKEDGNAAAIGTVATLNGNTHAVVLTASKMNNGNFLVTGIALDGDAVIYDARNYLQQMAESETEQGTAEQDEISAKLVDGQDGGFDYDSLNRITQTSGQQGNGSVDGSSKVWHNSNQENIQEGENNNGSNNTELLERRTVSAANRSGNGIRKQSENSRKISSFVEKLFLRQGKSVQGLRAGDSGWLVQQGNQEGKIRNRFENGIRGKISRITPSGFDTIGRKIDDGIKEKFKSTVFKDENGNLLSLYHWTQATFDLFAKGEFGFHFGTLDAARERYTQSLEESPDTQEGNYKEVYLNIANPYYIPFDAGVWCAHAVAYQLKEDGLISEQQYDRFAMTEGFFDNTYDNPAAEALRSFLSQKGYDGIIYENESEDAGSISVIALYPEQILTVAENGVLKEGNGVSEAPINETNSNTSLPPTDGGTGSFADAKNQENSNPDVLESRSYDYTESKENWRAENRNEGSTAEVESLDSIISGIEETFGVPINKGNIRQKKAAGIFKTKVNAIRTQLGNALPTICHELGHYFDLKHKLTRLGAIDEAVEVMQKTNPEFSKLYGENQQKGEAVAEFIREYLRDRTAAKQKYPKFFVEVTNALGEDLGKLNAISDKVNAYMYASLSEQIAVGITNRTNARWKKGSVGNRMKTVIDKVIKRIYDDVIAIRDVSEKAYKGVYDSRKAATVVNEIIFEGMRDVDGNFVEGFESESLSKILEPINNIKSKGRFKQLCESLVGRHENSMDEFNTYLALKRGLDLAPRGIPIFRNGNPAMQDVSEIQQMIDQMEAEYPQFKGVAEQLYAWQKALGQTYYVNTGMMSQADFDAMWKNNPHYVPFNRNVKQEIVKGSSTKFGKQNSEIKRIKGGSEELFDAIENIVLRSALMVQNAKNNRVMQILALDIEKGLIDSSIMEKISDTKAGAINAALEQKSNALKSDDQADGDFDDIDLVEWTGNAAGENIVWATINGQRVLYEVHDAELLKALLNSTPHQADILTQVVGKVNSAFKMMTTGGNLIWSVCSNSFRDFATGYYYGSEGNFLKYTRDYFAAARDVIGNRQSYQEAKGAGLGYTSRFASPKTLSRIMLKLGQNQEGRRALTNAFNSIIEGIQSVSEVVEATPRLAEYKRAIAQGKSKTDAVYAASEVTLNFDRKGDVAKKLDLVYPFFNVQMQGLYKQAQMIADPTTRMQFIRRKVVSSFVMAAFVIAANAVLGGKDEYEKLSDYTKNNYYCFFVGNGKFIKIPKARELDVLESALERMAETICYNNEFSDSFNGFAEYVFQAYAPLGFPDITALFGEKDRLKGFAKPILTDLLVVGSLAEIYNNENYAGSPIVPTQYQDLVEKEQYDNKTSGVAKLLGRIFNMSPMQIDHFMVSNTGFVGKMLKAWTAEDFDWTGGYGNQFTADTAYSNDVTERFYDELDEAEMYAKTYPENAEYQARYQQYSSAGSVVSYFYKQAKADPENARQYRMLAVAYAEEFLGDGEAQNEKLNSLYEQTRESGIYPYRKFQPSYSQKKKDSNGEYVRDEYDNVTSEEVTMTPQEFLEYINTYNETIDVVYEEIMNGITEPKLSAKALAKAKEHINDYARSGKLSDVMVAREAGISAADYYLITLGSSTNGSSGVNQEEAKTALNKSNLTKKQRSIMWDLMFPTAKYNPYGKRYY